MLGRAIDRVVGIFSPTAELRRMAARRRLQTVRADWLSDLRKGTGGNRTGYDAAKRNRLTRIDQAGGASENAIARSEIAQLRYDSWQLYRNNPHARKIVRQLQAKVIGKCMRPRSMAVRSDGTAHVEWRKRAAMLWREVCKEMDVRGKPGRGGLSFAGLAKTALQSVVLGGEVFYRYRSLTSNQQEARGLLLPFQLQLLHPDRVCQDSDEDKNLFFGIEHLARGERVAYHVYRYHPNDIRGGFDDTVRVPAPQMGHLYIQDDVDQYRGVPWLSAAILKMRSRADYEYSEITAAEMSACVVMAVKRGVGQDTIGLNSPSDWDSTDADSNTIENFAPGMVFDVGPNGQVDMLNPTRPNSNVAEFVNHLQRSEAAAVPGVKGSTLTQDYRNSSFSSERAADNDIWPELEDLQDWFASGFCQPIYEQVIVAAVEQGWFDGVEGFSPRDFADRQREYLAAEWAAPVPRSINPKDDAAASAMRMGNFTSSPQREAEIHGATFEDLLDEWESVFAKFAERGIPEEVGLNLLGIFVQAVREDEDGKSITEELDVQEGPENRLKQLIRANGNGRNGQ